MQRNTPYLHHTSSSKSRKTCCTNTSRSTSLRTSANVFLNFTCTVSQSFSRRAFTPSRDNVDSREKLCSSYSKQCKHVSVTDQSAGCVATRRKRARLQRGRAAVIVPSAERQRSRGERGGARRDVLLMRAPSYDCRPHDRPTHSLRI